MRTPRTGKPQGFKDPSSSASEKSPAAHPRTDAPSKPASPAPERSDFRRGDKGTPVVLDAAPAHAEAPGQTVDPVGVGGASKGGAVAIPKDQVPCHPAFSVERAVRIAALNANIYEYTHKATGAHHVHIETADDNNGFAVGFRTVPKDSTGVAHILEHTALCGSERYPVRDPFFMMTRRSLNTFMNALTAQDRTYYPFSTRNKKDFENLLNIYLDATFFPRLDPLDFSQEGHRLEFSTLGDPNSPLQFKGVVFNEMKGAMSAPLRQVSQGLNEALFPTSTYRFVSGGDPADIPKLTYEQFKAFHEKHYHPSNAVFVTYGDNPVVRGQEMLEKLALGRFSKLESDDALGNEAPFKSPKAVEGTYASAPNEPTEKKTYVALGWVTNESSDLRQTLRMLLLHEALLGNSAAPLRRALEKTELGTNPSLCWFDDSRKQATFSVGLEGSEPQHAAAVEALILGVIREVAEKGIPQAQLDAVLQRLELSQREIGGDPNQGLKLATQVLPAVLNGVGAAETLDLEPLLEELRAQVRDPDFIKSLARELLDNPHRVRLTVKPDPEKAARAAAAEAQRLSEIRAKLTPAQLETILAQNKALAERQEQKGDENVLPRLTLDDVPRDLKIPEGRRGEVAGMRQTSFGVVTNGLTYERAYVELPQMDPALADLLPLFARLLTGVGSGGRDYLQTQELQSATTGGLWASVSARGAVGDVDKPKPTLMLAGKALTRCQGDLTRLMRETLTAARFDELPRLRELVAQARSDAEMAITQSGHQLAMAAASAGVSASGALQQRWSGLLNVRTLKRLDEALKDPAKLAELGQQMTRIRDLVASAPRELAIVVDPEALPGAEASLAEQWAAATAPQATGPLPAPKPAGAVREAWVTNTQVNFCAKSYPSVPQNHPDAAALMVLARFLSNNFLHPQIREKGGAYGGGAVYSGANGSFAFYSYRDPRMKETLADMDAALGWLLEQKHDPRQLEEAILAIIGGLDESGALHEQALTNAAETFQGRTPEFRRQLRERVLKVTLEDLQRVAREYLKPERGNVAVVTSPKNSEAAAALGLKVEKL